MIETTTRTSEPQAPDDRRPLLHVYRLGRRPQIGDRALCGWVKRTPPHFATPGTHRPGYPYCVVCADFSHDGR